MKKIPPIEAVMSASPLSVELDASIRAAEDLMIDHDVRHLAVLDSGTLVGVVSDRDLAFASNSGDKELIDRLRVRNVCSLDVYAVEVGTSLKIVLGQMADRRLGSAIVTRAGQIVGIFTATDACRCFAEFLGQSQEQV